MGELGKHLDIVGRLLGVRAVQRGDQILVSGEPAQLRAAGHLLDELYAIATTGYPLAPSDVDQAARLLSREPDVKLRELYRETLSLGHGKKRIHPRSPRQRMYVNAMRDHDVVFGVGPAGTGKTYLAMAVALTALLKGDVNRIVLCRPAVEAGEKLGFLPGDLTEKVNPYLRPLYDALHDLMGFDRASRLVTKGVIEVAPLAFMRGRTLSDSYVILDEAQNSTPEQMKMLLTRVGLGSKVVVTGDLTQVDLPRGQKSGLIHALGVLEGIAGIATVRFTDVDIVRHPLVSEIVRAYDRVDAAERAAAERRRYPDRGGHDGEHREHPERRRDEGVHGEGDA